MKIKFNDDEAYQYLLSFDLFENKEEGLAYLADSYIRLKETIKIIPPLSPKSKVLELGANPYFLTLLLKKYYKIKPKLANFFGEGLPNKGKQIVSSKRFKEKHIFRFDHFNIEKERFPYAGRTFNMVINCEILEHLALDPVHSVREIYRVLKPKGFLVLTTPNVNRRENWFKLFMGENIYDLYSDYGVYGRHNREYTLNELRDILYQNGFDIVSAGSFFKKSYPSGIIEKFIRFLARKFYKNPHHGDHLFVLATKRSRSKKTVRPNYLYRSWQD